MWSSLFLSGQHIESFWTFPETSDGKEERFPPKRLQTARGPCAALSPAKSSSSKDPSPPSAHVLFPGEDQKENFMRIYSLFGVWDSPSITRLLPMAHSPVS